MILKRPSSSIDGLHDEGLARSSPLWIVTIRSFAQHRMAIFGSIVLVIICLGSILAPFLTTFDPIRTDLPVRLEPPSAQHWMGTDELGRDLFTRILYGGRISLIVGVASIVVSIVVGTIIGALAGYLGGGFDHILMRFTDVMISFPQIFTLILLVSLLGQDLKTIVFVIGIVAWMPMARLVRAEFLALKDKEYVMAARAIGAPGFHIVMKHLLPNASGPMIVAASLGVASAITSESGLSYLGMGLQPPTASWGTMLRNAQDQLLTAPWTVIFPGLMIFLVVICINFIGDGLRDALDPYRIEKR
jgi:peptide/nickel transport system permease protein